MFSIFITIKNKQMKTANKTLKVFTILSITFLVTIVLIDCFKNGANL